MLKAADCEAHTSKISKSVKLVKVYLDNLMYVKQLNQTYASLSETECSYKHEFFQLVSCLKAIASLKDNLIVARIDQMMPESIRIDRACVNTVICNIFDYFNAMYEKAEIYITLNFNVIGTTECILFQIEPKPKYTTNSFAQMTQEQIANKAKHVSAVGKSDPRAKKLFVARELLNKFYKAQIVVDNQDTSDMQCKFTLNLSKNEPD